MIASAQIGQAARIALAEGMHTLLPAEVMGSKTANRYKNIWRTIYILDSSLAAAVGAPTTVNSSCFPVGPGLSDHTPGFIMQNLHVNLSRLMSTS